jgi:hypothetical protein
LGVFYPEGLPGSVRLVSVDEQVSIAAVPVPLRWLIGDLRSGE